MTPWRISRKLVAVFLAVTVAPLALLAFVVERQVTRAFSERAVTNFDVVAAGYQRELETLLAAYMESAALVASRTQLRQCVDAYARTGDPAERARAETILRDALAAADSLRAISAVADDGTVLASVASRPELALAGPLPELGSVTRPMVVGLSERGGVESLRVATPMHGDRGRIGVLAIDASTDALRAMTLARTRVGSSGRVMVREPAAGGSGRILFAAHAGDDGLPVWVVAPAERALDASPGEATLAAERVIEPTGWVSRVEMSRAEALAPSARLRRLILATGLGVALLAVAAGYLVSRRFLRPIGRLVGVADSIRRGELDARADESRRDELGSLAASFNQMAAELVERNRELEHEVAERRRVELELARLARVDQLTSLPNRATFDELARDALARLARRGGFVAVLFVDLDNFKVVNDGFGHSVGDELLRAVARRMQAALRPTDRLARIGGDEFMVLLEEVTAPGDAVRVAERLHATLEAPFQVGAREIATSASVGVACCDDPGREVDALLSEADAAMYQAKRRGRARTEVFDDSLRRAALEQAHVERGLRGVVERGELELVYQPQYDLRSGRMCAVEALLRWRHPELGSLSASTFIAMAESSGAIVPIGEWVTREACARAGAWRALAADDFRVAVNLSAREIARPELVERVAATLEELGCPPEALWFEITESALMADPKAACERLRRLRDLGVRLCVDDFGTGYASLVYLRDLPLQGLKIDRSFVAGLGTRPEDGKIVDSTIHMAHALALHVTAEGVETQAQRRHLERLDCDGAQGFLFGRPLRAEAIDRLVAATRAS